MADGRDGTPDGPAPSRSERRHLANERRLRALGEAVDERSGVKRRRPKGRRHRTGRRVAIGFLVLVVLVVAVAGGAYLYANWRFDQIHKIDVKSEVKPISGQPFNILVVGSDSRAGLKGLLGAQTGASSDLVAGQRSDVVKIVHIDPNAGTISVISIPRDTMVTLLANQSLYGNANRINVNFGNGPSLLAQTVTANFGITINDTVVVSFAGLINAADALGGVYLDFPYPAADPYSGLRIRHAGCQLVQGFQALAVVRSRHYYYNVRGDGVWPGDSASATTLYDDGWLYDGTSDFGRIDRQSAFLRAMVDRAKKLYNPLTINSFLSKLPQGITLDQNFSLNELVGLAVRFHGLNANAIQTYTLPVYAATNAVLGDVLYVQEPEAQQLFVNVFGKQLETPTNPPPNEAGQTPLPPVIAPTTTTTAPTTSTSGTKSAPTTTTTNPALAVPNFDPRPCEPS
jgi:LCP family protein required for cell wall assembly